MTFLRYRRFLCLSASFCTGSTMQLAALCRQVFVNAGAFLMVFTVVQCSFTVLANACVYRLASSDTGSLKGGPPIRRGSIFYPVLDVSTCD